MTTPIVRRWDTTGPPAADQKAGATKNCDSGKKERIDSYLRLCHEKGIRSTVQKRAILEAVLDLDTHPTADQVHEIVVRHIPDISRTTVYRALETFARLGLITKACHPGNANRYDRNIGVGINNIQADVPDLATTFLEAERTVSEVDVEVLTDARTSELGRFAINRDMDDIGSFKTPTLRNIAVTAPYMHDGSVETLKDVVIHYNNGGVTDVGDPVNDFLSGGIRHLNLEEEQIDHLVAFMEALTSPEFAPDEG